MYLINDTYTYKKANQRIDWLLLLQKSDC